MIPLLLACVLAAPTDEEARVLNLVKEKHRTAVESIRSLSYSYQWTHLKNEPIAYTNTAAAFARAVEFETGPGRLWWTADRYRVRAAWSDDVVRDELVRFGKCVSYRSPARNLGFQRPRIGCDLESPTVMQSRLWALLLLQPTRDDGYARFHHLFDEPHTLVAVEPLTNETGERGDIRVEVTHDGGRHQFWFDPRRNYLIRKRVTHPAAEPKHRHEAEVLDFDESTPGTFFPKRIEYRTYQDGDLRQQSQTTLTDLRVNQPLGADAFRIPELEGQTCYDKTTRQKYAVNTDGVRISEPQPASEAELNGYTMDMYTWPLTTAAPPPPDAEPKLPWWLWAILLSLGLCLLAALVEIVRLRKLIPPASPPADTPAG